MANSSIFVCGDAKAMSKDTWSCFTEIVAEKRGVFSVLRVYFTIFFILDCPSNIAVEFLMQLKKSDRFIEDVWA